MPEAHDKFFKRKSRFRRPRSWNAERMAEFIRLLNSGSVKGLRLAEEDGKSIVIFEDNDAGIRLYNMLQEFVPEQGGEK